MHLGRPKNPMLEIDLGYAATTPMLESLYTSFDCFTGANLHVEFAEWCVEGDRACGPS